MFLVNADKPDHKLMDYAFVATNPRDKLPSVISTAFSHNSKYIAAGSLDSTVKVWDLKAKDKDNCTTLKSHLGGVSSLAWLKTIRNEPDVLASASQSGDIYLHSLRNPANPYLSLKLTEGINCLRASENPS